MPKMILSPSCGDTIPSVDLSQSNSVTVVFKSDGTDTDKGFNFTWYEVPSDTITTTTPPLGNELLIENLAVVGREIENPEFCAGTRSDWDCCQPVTGRQCGYGRGDCDADEDCAGDLR